ncbi:MAG: SDR family NAD(P)-dependent oxidoreductase, partial [bacterium]|nr:SDR family NAD(P)-dependent oxidoreductase [bacterium]
MSQRQSPTAAEISIWLVAQMAKVLALDPAEIEVSVTFSSYGVTSLDMVGVAGDLEQWLDVPLSPTLLYDHPSIETLSRHLAGEQEESSRPVAAAGRYEPIAIVGLGCRFPGAGNPAAFWRLLCNGVDAVREVPPERWDLEAFYDPDPAAPRKMNTRWGGFLERLDLFEPAFFGISAPEAKHMDPQQRLVLEVAWEALEDAGVVPNRLSGTQTGVFVGIATNDYSRLSLSDSSPVDAWSGTGTAASITANRISHLLGLKGPSMAVDTACSSSLVALHLACQSLNSGECEMALVGGVNVILSPELTIIFAKAGLMAPDGRCKVFDARADGYVRGEGAGVVVLKPLAQARAAGDPIYAVIRGSAVNQDGRTNGLMAPGGPSQESVLATAWRRAGIDPREIGYVEAHGTGTALGDRIEAGALGTALAPRREACWVGSVKSNIGHLEAAAGIAGLIKTALILHHRRIPPSLHYESPNPLIDFAGLSLRVARSLTPWPETLRPRRAGVSAFGFGGTNAHVALEEAPAAASGESRPWQQLLLSARTPETLEVVTANLAQHLDESPEVSLADVAYTLKEGRSVFEYRCAAVVRSREEAVAVLSKHAPERLRHGRGGAGEGEIVFLFPGLGDQYAGTVADLYRRETGFRATVDRCARLLAPELGTDLREILLAVADREAVAETRFADPALFVLEYALAEMLGEWGIRPRAMLGYSLGEYLAATLAGVFCLEDALAVVARRAQLIETLPAVPMGEEEARGLLMKPVVETFADFLGEIRLRKPSIPFLSNVTGTWIRDEEATDPAYWARHLWTTVRFEEALGELLEDPDRVFVEVGPGQNLGSFVKQHTAWNDQVVVGTLGGAHVRLSDQQRLLTSLAELWLIGAKVDWPGFYRREQRRKVPLPAHPFVGERYWIDTGVAAPAPAVRGKKSDPAEWFYRPRWRQVPLPEAAIRPAGSWLLFVDAWGVGERLAEALAGSSDPGPELAIVRLGEGFEKLGDHQWVLDPAREEDYVTLLRELGKAPTRVVHLWSLTPDLPAGSGASFEELQKVGLYSLLHLARALSREDVTSPLRLEVVTNHLHAVLGDEPIEPAKATLAAPCKVLPQECPRLTCRTIDVDPHAEDPGGRLLAELLAASAAELEVAWRRGRRFVRSFEPVRLESPDEASTALRQGGVYLITGGLGGVGLELAEDLARGFQARLVLLGRHRLPARRQWREWLATNGEDDPTSRKIRRVETLRELGAEVLVLAADVADRDDVRRAFTTIDETFGELDGVIHCAGVVRREAFLPAQQTGPAECELHFRPKVRGLRVLDECLEGRSPDFCLLFSSISEVLGGLGFTAYVAANLYMSSYARVRNRESPVRWLAVAWDTWQVESTSMVRELGTNMAEHSMTPAQGVAAFRRVLAEGTDSVLVNSTGDLQGRLLRAATRPGAAAGDRAAASMRPALGAAYVPVKSDTERRVARIFEKVVGVEDVGIHDNFFDLGGTSLSAMQVAAELQKSFANPAITSLTLFEAPSVAELARFLSPNELRDRRRAARLSSSPAAAPEASGEAIAIVGMSGRFPGASNVDEFWHNLSNGAEALSFFSDEELLASGVDPALLGNPGYVKARPVLEDVDLFDAAFFGYSPREAELTDPQMRLFLECSWNALESAGYAGDEGRGKVGVFAGSNISTYLLGLLRDPAFLDSVGELETVITNDRDSLATSVSYKLDLRGPSLTVQTFCSTSGVAIHLACQSLRLGESDMALAGGVSVRVPVKTGYLYRAGDQYSPDGHTRTFDQEGRGTVFGDGAGVVVLKRLSEAVRDRDKIHAVIRGSAVNNDGSLKVGYTAPSVEGQTEVVATALANAGVTAGEVSYVEAHGTATVLGDPIEVMALTRAFRLRTEEKAYCALGSVKTNIGHLDRAAGVASLIKTALALDHRKIPPSLHFERPNPEIDFADSPFYVNTELSEWPSHGQPRRAGVNCLGVGGTNVHLVLEEAPQCRPVSASRPYQLLVVSARSATGLEQTTADLARYLKAAEDSVLPDVAYTLQVGRKAFPQRRIVVAADRREAIAALEAVDERVAGAEQEATSPQVAFLFPDAGEHYVGMAHGLYRHEPVFREEVERCAALLLELEEGDLRERLYPRPVDDPAAANRRLDQARHLHPALFAVEWALARLLATWGIEPRAMLGYGLAEHVAACLSGVFSLRDALRLVALRGHRIDESVAATRPAQLSDLDLRPPEIPFLSTVTGTWITPQQATDPQYWARHPDHAGRFSEAVGEFLREPGLVLVEVGPGQGPGSVGRLDPAADAGSAPLLPTLSPVNERRPDQALLLASLGRLWLCGVSVDWKGFYRDEQRRRRRLPTSPFERRRFWLEAPRPAPRQKRVASLDDLVRAPEVGNWFYLPRWEPCPLVAGTREAGRPGPWWAFVDTPFAERLLGRLEKRGEEVCRIEAGTAFACHGATWTLDPRCREHYERLVSRLAAKGKLPGRIIHLWDLAASSESLERTLDLGFHSLVYLAQALGPRIENSAVAVEVSVFSTGVHAVSGDEPLRPSRSTVLGPLQVVPLEYSGLACRHFDLSLPAPQSAQEETLLDRLLAELDAAVSDSVVAYRLSPTAPEMKRWTRSFEPHPLQKTSRDEGSRLCRGGVYLITGGLGGLGLATAEHLAVTVGARLVLLGRSGLPPRAQWDRIDAESAAGRKIAKVKALEEKGTEFLVLAADVSDRHSMRRVIRRIRERYGKLDGVFHTAGVPAAGLMQHKTAGDFAPVMAPKLRGTRVLQEVLDELGEDPFLVLFSSIVSLTGGGPGQADYCAANAFLDTFAAARSTRQRPVISISWAEWQWNAWDESMAGLPDELRAHLRENRQRLGIDFAGGMDALERILASGCSHVVVSPSELGAMIALARRYTVDRLLGRGDAEPHARERATPAAGPEPAVSLASGDELERHIAAIWQRVLGFEKVGVGDNFFDLGGNSLIGLQVTTELQRDLGREVLPLLLYEAPTVSALAHRLRCADEAAPEILAERRRRWCRADHSDGVAIIGMGGRFPGAGTVEQLWQNLLAGREAITFFSDEELLAAGVEPAVLADPCYVKAGSVLADVDRFDAELFAVSPREAELMDPQHRLFLECAWETLDDGGYDPLRYPGSIGVYGGSNLSTYLLQILARPELAAT